MKKTMICFLVTIVILSLHSAVFAQEKLGQTGFQFLSVGQDARAVAMGEAFTTVESGPNALFYNPAGMANLGALAAVTANAFTWIADIKYMSLALSIDPWDGQYGVFGFSAQSINYGEMQGTMVWENPDGFVDTEIFEPSAIAIGAGYAKALSDRFLVGGQVRYVSQQLGKSVIPGEGTKKNVAGVLSFDFGTIYRTGFKSLVFGMSVRNFSKEIKFEEEGFQLPLTFKIGFSINALDFTDINRDQHSLLITLDAVHPRSHPEYINVGGEYVFLNTFAVRAGYISNQTEYDFTAGFGLKQFGFSVDYAYTPFGVFDSIHRFTVGFAY
jgi:hypothetical protein